MNDLPEPVDKGYSRLNSGKSPLARATDEGSPQSGAPLALNFNGLPVRAVVDGDGSTFWVAADVAAIMGYPEAAKLTRSLDEEEKAKRPVQTSSGIQMMNVITEGGVYHAAMLCRLDAGKAFRRWVFDKVLPEIRRTGSYNAAPEFPVPQTYAEALQLAANQALELEAARTEIAELTPAADAWQAMVDTTALHSVEEAAKLISNDPRITTIGRNKLFKRLKRWNWLIDTYRPYQAQIDNGRLVMKTKTYVTPDGAEHPSHRVFVTFKGLTEIHRRLLAEGQPYLRRVV